MRSANHAVWRLYKRLDAIQTVVYTRALTLMLDWLVFYLESVQTITLLLNTDKSLLNDPHIAVY